MFESQKVKSLDKKESDLKLRKLVTRAINIHKPVFSQAPAQSLYTITSVSTFSIHPKQFCTKAAVYQNGANA